MPDKLFCRKFIRPVIIVSVIIIIILTLVGIPVLTTAEFNNKVLAQNTCWQPNASAPIHWQWQIGTPFNTSTDQLPGVTVYDIDAYDNAASVVSALHAKGFIVIAYVSFGTYENWRPDAAGFPANVKGSSNGWPGENWLDIRSDTVKTIMAARLDLIKSKGFDAVEPDNVDGYSNSTGFPLTAQDQLNYNEWIAAQCHLRGLSVGLKNDIDQVTTLQPYFDWTLNEESYKYNEYSGLSAFTGNNKAVFEVEYGKSTPQASTLNALHFNSMTRDLDLVSPSSSGYVRLPCIPDTQNSWALLPQTTTTTTTTITTTTTTTPVVPTGNVKISTTPSGASLTADGTKSGLSPQTLTLSNGSHVIQASLSGYQDTSTSVNIAPGDNTTITLVLNPLTTTTTVHTTATTSAPPTVTTTVPPTTTTTTTAATIAPPPSGGGGGFVGGFGGGSSAIHPAPVVEVGTTSINGSISSDGIITTEAKAQSTDGIVSLILPKSIRFLTPDALPGNQVSMVQMPAAQQPPAPTGAEIIGLVYNLGPTGSTFDPPARLTFTYNDSQLLHGLNAKDLKLAYWDDLGNKWVTLENENIDMINGTITADINHFSYYAIIGYLPPPAKFVVSTLVVSPTSVKIGEPVKAAVTVTNTGGVTGAYNVVLNVNGIEEDSKYISLDAGAQTIVEFLITKYLANNYNLEVNGQRASFIIINPPVSDTTPSEVQIPAPQSVPVLTPIVTQIQSAVPQEPSGLITKASKSAAEMKSAHETTVHLALLGEVIAIALVLSGLTAIIIFVRRRYLLRKG